MAFSTQRGRPRSRPPETDYGTPELRLKHALGLTSEPIDLCLTQRLISEEQHWCGLHLRWLYTLRYGAPSITTRYMDSASTLLPPPEEMQEWRAMREQEYHESILLLRRQKRDGPVMRVCVFNEIPAFLSPPLRTKAKHDQSLADQLLHTHTLLSEGLSLLVTHWNRRARLDAQKAQTSQIC